jgi:hypothetical protein
MVVWKSLPLSSPTGRQTAAELQEGGRGVYGIHYEGEVARHQAAEGRDILE